jgi:hypothetical protein
MVGYLDNELLAKENPSAEKPLKKARGGVASRKAKTNSMVASAARSKGKADTKHPPSVIEDESSHPSTAASKAGDLSFVLNAPAQSPPRSTPRSTPTRSPKVQSVKHPQIHPESSSPPAELFPSVPEPPPTFTPAEPAHNRTLRDIYV